ncbi:MAG: nitrite reductase [Planctomyces sp.]|nr:nitrite reductase [Planctomyces sp.]
MAEYISVAKVGDIPEGEGRSYPVNGVVIAIFNVKGEYKAINDACPHAGASLAPGYVEGDVVCCPWHAWSFCLNTGDWMDAPGGKVRVDCYPIRVEGDDIQVKVQPVG